MRKSGMLFVLLIFSLLFFQSSIAFEAPDKTDVAILLKKKVVVLGPEIRLGDIAEAIFSDSLNRAALESIRIGEAPPPGESSDISLSFIKRCLRSAGYGNYVSDIRGPSKIRIITAQVEINKAFLREELAKAMNQHHRFFKKLIFG